MATSADKLEMASNKDNSSSPGGKMIGCFRLDKILD